MQGTDEEEEAAIAFGQHTDSCFITLALCSSVPGVQFRDPIEGKWVLPELGLDPTHVVVFVGEIVQALTKNVYQAAVHRVLRPTAGNARLSMPFLMRGRYDAVINTRGAEGLLSLENYSVAELHRFLELRRKRNKQMMSSDSDIRSDSYLHTESKLVCIGVFPGDATSNKHEMLRIDQEDVD